MDEEIEEELMKIYKNITICVIYKDIRTYEIMIFSHIEYQDLEDKIEYKYDVKLTTQANCRIIANMIDRKLLNFFKN